MLDTWFFDHYVYFPLFFNVYTCICLLKRHLCLLWNCRVFLWPLCTPWPLGMYVRKWACSLAAALAGWTGRMALHSRGVERLDLGVGRLDLAAASGSREIAVGRAAAIRSVRAGPCRGDGIAGEIAVYNMHVRCKITGGQNRPLRCQIHGGILEKAENTHNGQKIKCPTFEALFLPSRRLES